VAHCKILKEILGQEDYKVSNIKRKQRDFGTGASERSSSSFDHVHSMRQHPIPSHWSVTSLIVMDLKSYSVATEWAWRVPYQGNYSNLLEKCITQMNSTRTYEHTYSNFIPIVQSSGTGKSRLVDQVAKAIFTIPFNLRSTEDKTGS
jgi:hypothetical protein